MADTTSEATLKALLATLQSVTPAVVLRNEVLPVAIPAEGLVILRDGDPGEPETTMSPMTWHYVHTAEIEILTQGPERDAQFDAIKQEIGIGLAADRTLGGLCDWVEAMAPAPIDEAVFGADAVKAAAVPVQLHYSTTDPLG